MARKKESVCLCVCVCVCVCKSEREDGELEKGSELEK